MEEEIKDYINRELKGIDPRKLKQLIEFSKNGLIKKTGEELVEEFNYLFDRNDNPKCKSCALSRYRNSLYSTKDYWTKVYKKYDIDMENAIKIIEKMLEGKLDKSNALTEDEINEICKLDDDVDEKPKKRGRKKK